MGALPTEYAAVAPDVHGGDYIGPDGIAEMWGHPVKVGCSAAARDTATAARLWEVSEQLTNVHSTLGAGVPPAPSIKAARRWRARPLPRAHGLLILASRANGQGETLHLSQEKDAGFA